VAKCIRAFPEVADLLEKNEVNLSTVSQVASILDDQNKDTLLGAIRHKSQREVDEIIAGYKPFVSLRDRVRPVCVAVSDVYPISTQSRRNSLSFNSRCGSRSASANGAGLLPDGMDAGESTAANQGVGEATVGDGGSSPDGTDVGGAGFDQIPDDTHPGATSGNRVAMGLVSDATDRGQSRDNTGSQLSDGSQKQEQPTPHSPATRLERRLLIQFLASEAFMTKYEEAKLLLSNTLDHTSFENVFDVLIDEFLERHSPKRRAERRQKRQAKKSNCQTTKTDRKYKKTKTQKTPPKSQQNKPKRSRHIPAAVRDKVFERDNGRCTYVGVSGKRCGTTHGLQIDHIKPFARGGSNTPENLRLLCARHNQLEAERVYGKGVIEVFYRRE
jgi:5-methylcytosine-specific restriction endonuclease McrA